MYTPIQPSKNETLVEKNLTEEIPQTLDMPVNSGVPPVRVGFMSRPISFMLKIGLGVALAVVLGGLYLSLHTPPFLAGLFDVSSSSTLKVYVSLPQRRSLGQSIMNSIQLAFEQAGYRAGEYHVEFIPLDDGDEAGIWSADLERANAERAAADPDTVAYIGAYNSGASKVSMPILNEAGIVQISPGNTWPGLTKPGFQPGEPGIFYPAGIRHYVRVCPADDLQGPAGAIWARELGAKSVYIIDDGEAYGKGIADLFDGKAYSIGLTVLGHKTIDKKATDFSEDIEEIRKAKPDLVYYGGTTPNGGPILLAQMREKGLTSMFMGPDDILSQDFIDQAGDAAEGVYATTVGAPALSIGTPEAKQYYRDYTAKYGKEPEVYGAFGFEAARVLLAAIAKSPSRDRAAILDTVRNTKNYTGLFGTWSFDQNGDTTLRLVSANKVKAGSFVFLNKLPVE